MTAPARPLPFAFDRQLATLRYKQDQLLAQIRDRENVVAKQERRRDAKTKILLGEALLELPAGEREALLGILLPRLDQRAREFVAGRLSLTAASLGA